MSKVNIRRAVENIRASTTVYTPITEIVFNAIEAIAASGRNDGRILIRLIRKDQFEIDGSLADVQSVEIEDNGIGFTDANRQSFDTLYSDLKISEGGKGFGRFTCLKYFQNLTVDSVYRGEAGLLRRRFAMGKDTDIIVNETVEPANADSPVTVVRLDVLKDGKALEKNLRPSLGISLNDCSRVS